MKSGFALIVVFNILAVVILAMVTLGVGNGAAAHSGFVLKPYFPPEFAEQVLRPSQYGSNRRLAAEAAEALPRPPDEDEDLARFRPLEIAPPWTQLPDGSVSLDR